MLGENDTYELSTSDLKQIIFEKEKVDIKITEIEGDWLQASEMLELAG
jgi:hypothetical protein